MRAINVGWWESLAHAIFGVTGSNPIPGLEEHVQAVADLSRPRPEWLYPAEVTLFSTDRVNSAAVVGQFSSVGVWNPTDSGLLIVLDQFQHNSGITLNLVLGAVLTQPGTLISVAHPTRDTRWLTPAAAVPLTDTPSRFAPLAAGVFSRAAVTQITSNVKEFLLPAVNTSLRWAMPDRLYHVLGPGGFVAMEAQVSNQGVTEACFGGYALRLHKGKRA